jgi:hypothetical protein
MIVHRTALWILLVLCSVAGGLCALASELRATRSDGARSRVERYMFGTLTGVGMGMSVAALVFLAAAIIVRLEP